MEHEPSPAPEDRPAEGTYCTLTLIRKKDGSEISRYPVDGEVTSFGRDESNDVRLYYNDISRFHATLHSSPDLSTATLKITGANGVEVNGKLTKPPAEVVLKAGDMFEMRKKRFLITFPHSTAASSARPATPRRRRPSQRMSLMPNENSPYAPSPVRKAAPPTAPSSPATPRETAQQKETDLDVSEAAVASTPPPPPSPLVYNRTPAATPQQKRSGPSSLRKALLMRSAKKVGSPELEFQIPLGGGEDDEALEEEEQQEEEASEEQMTEPEELLEMQVDGEEIEEDNQAEEVEEEEEEEEEEEDGEAPKEKVDEDVILDTPPSPQVSAPAALPGTPQMTRPTIPTRFFTPQQRAAARNAPLPSALLRTVGPPVRAAAPRPRPSFSVLGPPVRVPVSEKKKSALTSGPVGRLRQTEGGERRSSMGSPLRVPKGQVEEKVEVTTDEDDLSATPKDASKRRESTASILASAPRALPRLSTLELQGLSSPRKTPAAAPLANVKPADGSSSDEESTPLRALAKKAERLKKKSMGRSSVGGEGAGTPRRASTLFPIANTSTPARSRLAEVTFGSPMASSQPEEVESFVLVPPSASRMPSSPRAAHPVQSSRARSIPSPAKKPSSPIPSPSNTIEEDDEIAMEEPEVEEPVVEDPVVDEDDNDDPIDMDASEEDTITVEVEKQAAPPPRPPPPAKSSRAKPPASATASKKAPAPKKTTAAPKKTAAPSRTRKITPPAPAVEEDEESSPETPAPAPKASRTRTTAASKIPAPAPAATKTRATRRTVAVKDEEPDEGADASIPARATRATRATRARK